MPATVTLNVPLNRVEGDLEIRVELEESVVTNAWSCGTMYRGFEGILRDRGALDGLVITPRICGICGTAHLTAAAQALDRIAGVTPPPNALRIRNAALMTEHIQSDLRHSFLMFTPDFCNRAHVDSSLYAEAQRRYAPFRGETVQQVIAESKRLLEIIAILGGQWPHSSYMVPGGIASTPSRHDLAQCRLLLKRCRTWYEERILGCRLSRWQQVNSQDALNAWVEERGEHRNSDLGFFLRFCRERHLDRIGRGHGNFISFGSLDMPMGTRAAGLKPGPRFIPAGFAHGREVVSFDQQKISEHVACSWFEDYDGGRHPFDGVTRPYATGRESQKYSWAKAPRYDGLPAETGPLAEMVIAWNPLFRDLVDREGPHAMVRQLARIVRPAALIPALEDWLAEASEGGTFYKSPGEIEAGIGYGLTQASRGALGHWVKIVDAKIAHYQIITPTAWNASPRDSAGVRGPWEEALIGTEIKDHTNPVELGHVIRSFDACLVCTVHTLQRGRTTGRMNCGGWV